MNTAVISKAKTSLPDEVAGVLENFTRWFESYGEVSWDHQSFYAGPYGRFAKGLYYSSKVPGILAVAPMVFSEAYFPPARKLFHYPIRLPIADAHYAMGYNFLCEATGEAAHLDKAAHFLEVLKTTRCPDYPEYCWGYPFDWVTRVGVYKRGTPLITTTPYVFEAFLQYHKFHETPDYEQVLRSIVRHARTDIKDFKYSDHSDTCSYTPFDKGLIVNASAYRAGMLATAAAAFKMQELLPIASRNVNFVLEVQNPDGSWPYAVDGERDFIDHFHTCFVMKGLAKVYLACGDDRVLDALERGVDYYLKNLFGEDGMPKPFAKAPRRTVYLCELYDCAECINLCVLLRPVFPQLQAKLDQVLPRFLKEWVKRDGSFRSRKLKFGWDNVPMHRWGQSQMFRALAYYLWETRSRQ